MRAVEDRARCVKTDTDLCARLVVAYVAGREPYPMSPHIEERFHNRFPGRDDEARINAFHEAPWSDRLAIVQSLQDERLQWFGLRLIYFEARSTLPASTRTEVEHRLLNQLMGDRTGCLTYQLALSETHKLTSEGQDQHGTLTNYRNFLEKRSARAMAFRAQFAPV